MNEYQDVFNPYFLSNLGEKKEISSYQRLSALPKDAAVTMAYVPFQQDTTMFEPSVALERGTLYETLDKPFLGKRVMPK